MLEHDAIRLFVLKMTRHQSFSYSQWATFILASHHRASCDGSGRNRWGHFDKASSSSEPSTTCTDVVHTAGYHCITVYLCICLHPPSELNNCLIYLLQWYNCIIFARQLMPTQQFNFQCIVTPQCCITTVQCRGGRRDREGERGEGKGGGKGGGKEVVPSSFRMALRPCLNAVTDATHTTGHY